MKHRKELADRIDRAIDICLEDVKEDECWSIKGVNVIVKFEVIVDKREENVYLQSLTIKPWVKL